MKKAAYICFLFLCASSTIAAQNIKNESTTNNSKYQLSKSDSHLENKIEPNNIEKGKLDVLQKEDGKQLDSSILHQRYPLANKAEFSGLIIDQDERIELLCQQYMDEKEIRGFKVQIYSGHSRWEASKVKTDFISAYPDLSVPNLIYQSPNFKLRVGEYRDRFEAERVLRTLKKEFPSAFIVKDKVNIQVKN